MTNWTTPEEVRRAGKLVLNEHLVFRRIIDVAAIFDVPSSAVRRGFFYRGAVDLSASVTVWWPKILPLRPRAGGWTNKPIYDKNEVVGIEERNENAAVNLNHLNGSLQQNCQRVVFGNFKPGKGYEYLGVFEVDKNASSPTFHVRSKNPSGCWGFVSRSSLH